MKKNPYQICPQCGGTLDPGERCDCQREEVTQGSVMPVVPWRKQQTQEDKL